MKKKRHSGVVAFERQNFAEEQILIAEHVVFAVLAVLGGCWRGREQNSVDSVSTKEGSRDRAPRRGSGRCQSFPWFRQD